MFTVQLGRFRLPGRTPFPRGLFAYPIPRTVPGAGGTPPKVTPYPHAFARPRVTPKHTPKKSKGDPRHVTMDSRTDPFYQNPTAVNKSPFFMKSRTSPQGAAGRTATKFDDIRLRGPSRHLCRTSCSWEPRALKTDFLCAYFSSWWRPATKARAENSRWWRSYTAAAKTRPDKWR